MSAVAELSMPRGTLRLKEPMARHTSWRVGGPAERFYEPASVADLAAFLAELPADEPLFWMGLGSNLLVRDGGMPGTVIMTSGLLNALDRRGEERVRAEVGVACAKVARFAARAGLKGAEFLAGIPGTMGGALAMNAGAFGGETWAVVERVETLDRAGGHHERTPQDYRIEYRQVSGRPEELFIAAHLRLERGDVTESSRRIRDLLKRRSDTQPMGQASCGSVFRNPPGDFAARLIEASGLKGRCIGGACVSEKHANFIVNTGGARAADIESLIHEVADTVERRHGVRLVQEVKIVGRTADDA